MSFARKLRKAARLSSDVSALASGDSKRIGRRAKNRAVAKALGALGFWKLFSKLWR